MKPVRKINLIILSTIFTLISCVSFAQTDIKATALLDAVSAKMDGYDNIFIEFKYILNNEEENISQETEGFVTIQNQNYSLNFIGNTIMYNGNNTYVIVPEDEEVSIYNEDPNEESAITPSKMLVFYQDGYVSKWDQLKNINGRNIQFVKLTPIDSESDIENVLLGIDAYTKHIYKLIEKGKNGTETTLFISSFKVNQPIADSLFVF